MKPRRRMLVALYGALLFGAAGAQGTAKVYRIGWLVGSVPKPAVVYGKIRRPGDAARLRPRPDAADRLPLVRHPGRRQGVGRRAGAAQGRSDRRAGTPRLARRPQRDAVGADRRDLRQRPRRHGRRLFARAPRRQRHRLHLGRWRGRSREGAGDHEGALSQGAPLRNIVEPGKQQRSVLRPGSTSRRRDGSDLRSCPSASAHRRSSRPHSTGWHARRSLPSSSFRIHSRFATVPS